MNMLKCKETKNWDWLTQEYFSEKGTTDAKVQTHRYRNNLLDDIEIATKELEENPTVTAYNNLIKVKEFARNIEYDYTMELYDLLDEYGVSFLEDKALYFEQRMSAMANDIRGLKIQKEEFKQAKERKAHGDKIMKLRAEKARIEAELALELHALGGN